jgi:hypothetical protein
LLLDEFLGQYVRQVAGITLGLSVLFAEGISRQQYPTWGSGRMWFSMWFSLFLDLTQGTAAAAAAAKPKRAQPFFLSSVTTLGIINSSWQQMWLSRCNKKSIFKAHFLSLPSEEGE